MELRQGMKTQTEAYWETEFEITDADVEFLYSYFGEHGSPCTVDELAVALVDRHYHLEKKRLAQESGGSATRAEPTIWPLRGDPG